MSRLLDLPLMSLFKVSKRTPLCMLAGGLAALSAQPLVSTQRVRFGDKG